MGGAGYSLEFPFSKSVGLRAGILLPLAQLQISHPVHLPFVLSHTVAQLVRDGCTKLGRSSSSWLCFRSTMHRYAANMGDTAANALTTYSALRKGLLAMAGATCKFGGKRNFPCGPNWRLASALLPTAVTVLVGSSIVVVSSASN